MKMHETTTLNITTQSTASTSLTASLQQAFLQKRLAFGVFECAQRLERYVRPTSYVA